MTLIRQRGVRPGRAYCVCSLLWSLKDCTYHRDHLSGTSNEEHLAATESLNEEEGRQGGERIDRRKDCESVTDPSARNPLLLDQGLQLTTTKNERKTSFQFDRLLKEDSGVVDDGVATSKLRWETSISDCSDPPFSTCRRTCWKIWDEAPTAMRRKCCFLPPTKSSRAEVPPWMEALALMPSTIIRISRWVSSSSTFESERSAMI